MPTSTLYVVLADQAGSAPEEQDREHRLQAAMIEVRRRFGKNALVRGMNLLEGATAMERNRQIGGHKA